MSSCKHGIQFEHASLKPSSCSYTPPKLLSMQCPVCEELRYKRDWTPSQGHGYSAHTWQLNCCKVCSADHFYVAPDALARYWQQIKNPMAALERSPVRWTELFQQWMRMPPQSWVRPSRLGHLAPLGPCSSFIDSPSNWLKSGPSLAS